VSFVIVGSSLRDLEVSATSIFKASSVPEQEVRGSQGRFECAVREK
jgi:hypothetical protein